MPRSRQVRQGDVPLEAVVSHARHAPVTLAAGVWQVIHQREYDLATVAGLARLD